MKYLIIDCSSVCYAAYHALTGLKHDSVGTSVLYGFIRRVVAIQNDLMTDAFVFCFDKGKNKRYSIFPEYKQKRHDKRKEDPMEKAMYEELQSQIKELRDSLLSRMGFSNVYSFNGYEADDIIASVCLNINPEDEAYIVTRDADMWQCVNDRVRVYDPQTKRVISRRSFRKEWGFDPSKWWRVKVLAGCKSDAVPGIKGVGEMTAAKYIRGELKPESVVYKRIREEIKQKELIRRNTRLIKLPIKGTPDFKPKPDRINQGGWKAIASEKGIKTIQRLNVMKRKATIFDD